MAKKGKKKDVKKRNVLNITKRKLLSKSKHVIDINLDNRFFQPKKIVPLEIQKINVDTKDIFTYRPKIPKQNRIRVNYTVPRKIAVCKRREKRREILFKTSKIGKGRKVSKNRRYTEDSKVRC